jgi:hypothetical protein
MRVEQGRHELGSGQRRGGVAGHVPEALLLPVPVFLRAVLEERTASVPANSRDRENDPKSPTAEPGQLNGK